MDTASEPPRAYDGTSRRAAARRNRRAVIDACRQALLRDGYHATTIRDIAAAAGVSPEMIYKTFGTKLQLVKAVYDVTVAGDDEAVPMAGRAAVREFSSGQDAQRRIALYARFVTSIHARLGGLLAIVNDPDPALRDFTKATEDERLRGLGLFIGDLAKDGLLHSQLDRQHLVQACWALTSSALYMKLVHACGWDPEQYAAWIATLLTTMLLPET